MHAIFNSTHIISSVAVNRCHSENDIVVCEKKKKITFFYRENEFKDTLQCWYSMTSGNFLCCECNTLVCRDYNFIQKAHDVNKVSTGHRKPPQFFVHPFIMTQPELCQIAKRKISPRRKIFYVGDLSNRPSGFKLNYLCLILLFNIPVRV